MRNGSRLAQAATDSRAMRARRAVPIRVGRIVLRPIITALRSRDFEVVAAWVSAGIHIPVPDRGVAAAALITAVVDRVIAVAEAAITDVSGFVAGFPQPLWLGFRMRRSGFFSRG